MTVAYLIKTYTDKVEEAVEQLMSFTSTSRISETTSTKKLGSSSGQKVAT